MTIAWPVVVACGPALLATLFAGGYASDTALLIQAVGWGCSGLVGLGFGAHWAWRGEGTSPALWGIWACAVGVEAVRWALDWSRWHAVASAGLALGLAGFAAMMARTEHQRTALYGGLGVGALARAAHLAHVGGVPPYSVLAHQSVLSGWLWVLAAGVVAWAGLPKRERRLDDAVGQGWPALAVLGFVGLVTWWSSPSVVGG